MLSLRGAPALSEFRLKKLAQRISESPSGHPDSAGRICPLCPVTAAADGAAPENTGQSAHVWALGACRRGGSAGKRHLIAGCP